MICNISVVKVLFEFLDITMHRFLKLQRDVACPIHNESVLDMFTWIQGRVQNIGVRVLENRYSSSTRVLSF